MKGETEVKEYEMKPHNTTDCATEKWLIYADKEEKEDSTGGNIVLISQESKA